MLNALSIDMEEWFCVSGFEDVIRRDDWDRIESRIEPSTFEILDLLERHGTKATFFVLGWIAERHPGLIRTIWEQGHEIASHGYDHHLAYKLSPVEFRTDVCRSIDLLRELANGDCIGYRAPSFSLRRDMTEAWEALFDAGIRYDSSIFPVVHDRYGEPDAPRFPFRLRSGRVEIVEFPMSTITAFAKNLPVGGGGYLRLYPLSVTRWAIRRINREGYPAVVYFHPWEVDPRHPKPSAPWLALLRHRVGIGAMSRKLDRLLNEFRFGPLRAVIESMDLGIS